MTNVFYGGCRRDPAGVADRRYHVSDSRVHHDTTHLLRLVEPALWFEVEETVVSACGSVSLKADIALFAADGTLVGMIECKGSRSASERMNPVARRQFEKYCAIGVPFVYVLPACAFPGGDSGPLLDPLDKRRQRRFGTPDTAWFNGHVTPDMAVNFAKALCVIERVSLPIIAAP